MPTISLRVRYYRTTNLLKGRAWREENLREGEVTWRLKGEEAALVLVDCWDKHFLKSHLERTNQIVHERIAPTIKACHEAGIAVVHAPSPGQARLYPQWLAYASDGELFPQPEAKDEWPPAEFRERSGEHAQYAKPRRADIEDDPRYRSDDRRIAAEIEPQEGECVIATGGQLHRLLRDRKILHLFYAGFAANMCVPYRDYGTRAMHNRGYNIILLRDCTTAIEADYTLPTFSLTEAAVLDVEMCLGFSTTSAALIKACTRRGGKRK